jgi:DNA-binding response OmpR family regulator
MLLIVDDDPAFLESAEEKLDHDRGVLFAKDGKHARALLETVGPNFGVMIVDLDLPDEDGFSVIREARREYPKLPIIAMSGVCQSEVLECAKLIGAAETLRKPITPEWNLAIARVRAAGDSQRA